MKPEVTVLRLLRWREACAESEAPPAPRAARLVEQARPWWEAWPERFRALATHLERMRANYGYAMSEHQRASGSHLVPVLVVSSQGEGVDAAARVLFFYVRDGKLRLRVQLESDAALQAEAFAATFVADSPSGALMEAPALRSTEREYRIESDVPPALEQAWGTLRVTDPMPFRLILRCLPSP
ncbi:MAG: hypothetical protein IAE82_11970 [Opitutaceae bacterium]|nr:hypothetical protein [Opitutaceae bacterium]